MNSCPRCNGNILESYDENLREWYIFCIQCGNRPQEMRGRVDGKPLNAPPKCSQRCGRDCIEIMQVRTRAKYYLTKCKECREKQNLQRRLNKRAEKRKEAA